MKTLQTFGITGALLLITATIFAQTNPIHASNDSLVLQKNEVKSKSEKLPAEEDQINLFFAKYQAYLISQQLAAKQARFNKYPDVPPERSQGMNSYNANVAFSQLIKNNSQLPKASNDVERQQITDYSNQLNAIYVSALTPEPIHVGGSQAAVKTLIDKEAAVEKAKADKLALDKQNSGKITDEFKKSEN